MRYLTGFIIIFILSNCTRISVIEDTIFPAINETVAVFCFLTPSDSIHVSLKAVRIVTNKNKEIGVENAEIIIRDLATSGFIRLQYISKGGYYGGSQKNFKILPNHRYKLTVNVTNSLLLTSECTVPNQGAIIEKLTFGDPFDDGFQSKRRVEARWQDVSNQNQKLNYLISSGGKFKDAFSGEIRDVPPSLKSFKDIAQSENTFFYTSSTADDTFPKNYFLHTLDSDLYQFQKMAQKMDDITKKGSTDVLGAYQGIIPEYTNIQNGYGIFGAYLTTSLTVTIK